MEPEKPPCPHNTVRIVDRWRGDVGRHHVFQCQDCDKYVRPVWLEVDIDAKPTAEAG